VEGWGDLPTTGAEPPTCQVELVGFDVFGPATIANVRHNANDVPAWLLDTDYNGLCFQACQAQFNECNAVRDAAHSSRRLVVGKSPWVASVECAGTALRKYLPAKPLRRRPLNAWVVRQGEPCQRARVWQG
jgi:hypothetical protein